ncbi:MAG: hypothetical protein HEP71_34285 [Roseivirga sp.]|nr:hypothetical protein [Roseivirga sp.]
MEKTENQRLTEALSFLKNSKLIQNNLNFLELSGIKQGRLSYLKSDSRASLTSDEVLILEEKFPQINWGSWVKLGKGEPINHESNSSKPVQSSIDDRLTAIQSKHNKLVRAIEQSLAGNPLETEIREFIDHSDSVLSKFVRLIEGMQQK